MAPTPADAASSPGASWWFEALGVPEAHEETTGEGATVIMADGSIDATVPALEGSSLELRQGCLGEQMESNRVPDAEHGTWMASLVAGTGRGSGSAGGGIAGIAPDAELQYFTLDADPNSPGISCKVEMLEILGQAVRGVEGGPILSLSLGNLATGWDQLQRDVEELGGVAVASAGDYEDSVNRGMMDFPAAHAGWVAVMALDDQARPWDANPLPYRSLGKYRGYPTIAAPGVGVPGYTWKGDRFVAGEPQDGTSPATAIVAGALALVRSKYPEATGNQLIQHLIHFDAEPEEFAYSDAVGFGVVSLRNMLANDPTGWPDENPLMEGNPQRVIDTYPMSVYGQADDGADAEADAGDTTGEPEASSEDGSETTAEATGAPAQAGDDGSSSALPWLLGGGVALLLAAGGVVLARRSGGSGSTTRTNA
ncbi:S8/S53 family peptidase [Nocardioides sp. HDW12B]|uniref:S8/S53 family peptidase n=1 Tax=Nocardioides sp. HDW12B TaxID=2714939 RepID=UPI001409E55A|nr:S8/S53 family peptidase [Nocardioides sp. HDW12B]QIK67717.1 S8/S53 family peptidase [Nocardioides sp. HDW12B]